MRSFLRYAGQGLFYALAALVTGYLSVSPTYEQAPPDMAQIKLSFTHGSARVEDCRRLTPQEIAALPPRERRPNTCSRERVPVYVEFAIDGALAHSETLEPSGVSRDGPARIYRKFLVPAGTHTLKARMRDSKRETGFDYEMERQVMLTPGRSLAIDFRAESNGFILR